MLAALRDAVTGGSLPFNKTVTFLGGSVYHPGMQRLSLEEDVVAHPPGGQKFALYS